MPNPVEKLEKNKILVCSSEQTTRERFKLILGWDYNLILCEDVEQCLGMINRTEFSHFFLDIEGQDEAKVKEVLSRSPSIRTTIIYSTENMGRVTELVHLGAYGYIVKPFKSEEILAVCK